MNKFYEDCDNYKVITTDEDVKKLNVVLESVKDTTTYKRLVDKLGEIIIEIYHLDYGTFDSYSLVIHNRVVMVDDTVEEFMIQTESFKYSSLIGPTLHNMLFRVEHVIDVYEFTQRFKKFTQKLKK